MVRSFFLTVLFDQRYKLLNTEVIASLCIFTPIASCFLTHEVHSHDRLYDFILDNRKCLSLFLPRCPCNLFKFFFELFKSAFIVQLTFKFCKIWNRSAVSLHFIKYLHEDFHDGFFSRANLCRSFGINIKEHNIRRNGSGIGHLGNQHRIIDFLSICKVLDGSLSFYHTVF